VDAADGVVGLDDGVDGFGGGGADGVWVGDSCSCCAGGVVLPGGVGRWVGAVVAGALVVPAGVSLAGAVVLAVVVGTVVVGTALAVAGIAGPMAGGLYGVKFGLVACVVVSAPPRAMGGGLVCGWLGDAPPVAKKSTLPMIAPSTALPVYSPAGARRPWVRLAPVELGRTFLALLRRFALTGPGRPVLAVFARPDPARVEARCGYPRRRLSAPIAQQLTSKARGGKTRVCDRVR